jgi:hypothetical protein
MTREPPYFMYFPGSYRWSAAFVGMMSSIPWGGADMSEIDMIGRLLKSAELEDDEAWFRACVQVADRVRAHAERHDQSRHPVSASAAYLRASNYYQMAERFRTPKDTLAREAYRTGVQCFHRYAALSEGTVEIVEVPFEGKSLPGIFVKAQNAKSPRPPCVVFFDGLDITKELQYTKGVPDLVKRGISCLVMDGPGTGEAIRFRGFTLRHDYEVAGSACIDYLEKRGDVDARKIGVVAVSLGGYYAPRCASMEPRFAACIAWGAIWDYRAIWKRRIDAAFKTSLSVPGHHIMWVFGVDSLEAALKRLEPFRLDGVVQKMRCPFLLTHGADDEQIPLADAQALFDACGSGDKTLRVFTAEEGGAQHCQRDYLSLGAAEMWNWFEDKLVR